jgi:predicted RNA-binding protein YlqC (UPF0109 family)
VEALVANIARALVDQPDQVSVRANDSEAGTVLELRVAPGDFGKVIGRQGRTARSLRTIVGAAALKKHARCTLDIVE